MKIFLTFLCLTTVSLVQSQTSNFTSSKYGYTINKPEGFELKTASGIHIDYKVVSSDGSSILMNVSRRLPEEKGIDAHSYSKEFFQTSFNQTDRNITIIKTEKIIIDGKKTFLIYYNYSSNTGNNFNVIEAYLFFGDNAYVITTTSVDKNYEGHRIEFLKTIKSLKF